MLANIKPTCLDNIKPTLSQHVWTTLSQHVWTTLSQHVWTTLSQHVWTVWHVDRKLHWSSHLINARKSIGIITENYFLGLYVGRNSGDHIKRRQHKKNTQKILAKAADIFNGTNVDKLVNMSVWWITCRRGVQHPCQTVPTCWLWCCHNLPAT